LGWVPPAGSSKPAMIDLSRGIEFSEITMYTYAIDSGLGL